MPRALTINNHRGPAADQYLNDYCCRSANCLDVQRVRSPAVVICDAVDCSTSIDYDVTSGCCRTKQVQATPFVTSARRRCRQRLPSSAVSGGLFPVVSRQGRHVRSLSCVVAPFATPHLRSCPRCPPSSVVPVLRGGPFLVVAVSDVASDAAVRGGAFCRRRLVAVVCGAFRRQPLPLSEAPSADDTAIRGGMHTKNSYCPVLFVKSHGTVMSKVTNKAVTD